MISLNFICSLATVILLLSLYFYMHSRMETMVRDQKLGRYKPNMNRSLLELFIFILVYLICAVLTSVPEFNIGFVVLLTIGAFILSLLVFNKLVFLKLGQVTTIFATLIVYILYALSSYLYFGHV